MRLALIMTTVTCIAISAQAAQYDVEWFVKNPKQRAAWLQKCHRNPQTAPQACENARQADLHSYVDESAAKLDRGTSEPGIRPVPKQ